MKIFSLFSGIGGFEKGFLKIPDVEIVGHSEIDKWADMVYANHFPGSHNYGDIRKINPEDLPDFDILCGGFPCQSFSSAGKRGGIYNDMQARGTLFFEILRIAKKKKPRIILLENVKGLLSSSAGFDFIEILGALADTMAQLWGDGWQIQYEILNTKNFSIPQNRERVFIIGRHIREGCGQKIFPLGQNDKIYNDGEISRRQSSLQKQKRPGSKNIESRRTCASGRGGKTATMIADCGNNEKDESARPRIFAMRGRKNGQQIEKRKNGCTNSLTTIQKDNYVNQYNSIRRLTPVEYERLQGFPDNWTQYGINDKGEKVLISDNQRYKMLGNAASCNVIEAIARKIAQSI